MAPTANNCVASQLRQLIHYHIDNNLLQNALFFAERLLALDHRSTESAYLVALCHLRLGDHASAFEYAKPAGSRGTHVNCAYVYAQAALALGNFKDGITALEKSRGHWGGKNNFGKHSPSKREPQPDAAAISCLLGKLWNGYDNKQKAISCFEESLKLNPFMWDAFTNLCDMGAPLRVQNVFRMNEEMKEILTTGGQEQFELPPQGKAASFPSMPDHDRSRPSSRTQSVTEGPDPFNNAPSRGFNGGLFGTIGGMSQKLSESNPSLTNLPAAGGGGIGPEAMETPTGPSAAIDVNIVRDRRELASYNTEPPQAPVRKNRTLQGLGMDFSMDAPKLTRAISSKRSHRVPEPVDDSATTHALRNQTLGIPGVGDRKRTASGQVMPRQTSEEPGAPQRRSVRLFNQIRPAGYKSTSAASTTGPAPARELRKAKPPISRIIRPNTGTSTVGRQVSGNRKPVEDTMDLDQKDASRSWQQHPVANPQPQKSMDLDPLKQEEALRSLLELFRKFGSGYLALSKFQCQEALQIYGSLPKNHQDTPWVMSQMGRACYEQAAYDDAEKFFRKIRQIAPTRFEDMEIYSTILWHLKRETELAFLAHELIDASWKSPEAWCALGNSWSLARDHEQALRCFKRATQLNPKFAYAFTLQGHEHVANEEYDKALTSYRSGIAADGRHYNAWYGVGRVYEKLGNYEKASKHFSAASSINPANAVLICCIGTVYEKQQNYSKALSCYAKATELAPRSTLTRFKKARVLMKLGEMHIALGELMILKDIAPDEAMVHFLLGRAYKMMRDKPNAVRHFTIAMNLDPKATTQIKEMMESLEDDDDEEVSMMT